MSETPWLSVSLWIVSWGAISLLAVTLVGVAFGVLGMSPAQYVIAQVCFNLSALVLAARLAWWLAIEQASASVVHRLLLALVLIGLTGVLWIESVAWTERLNINSKLTVRIVFSDSPLFTEPRKVFISTEIEASRTIWLNLDFRFQQLFRHSKSVTIAA